MKLLSAPIIYFVNIGSVGSRVEPQYWNDYPPFSISGLVELDEVVHPASFLMK